MPKQPRTQVQPSMDPLKWNFLYSAWGVATQHPYATVNGWEFAFPHAGTADWEVDYVTQYFNSPIKAAYLEATFTIVASEDAVFNGRTEPENTGGDPAALRLLIQSSLTADYGRWMSNPQKMLLQNGTYTLKVPLIHAYWQPVPGVQGSSIAGTMFAKTLSAPTQVGIVFGGGSFFGHGANMTSGDAHINCTKFAFT